MASSSQENSSTQVREVVGAFGSVKDFGAAIDDLQSSGIDRARLTVLAGSPQLEKDLEARGFTCVKQILDLPDLPRRALVEPESIGAAQGALVSGLLYVGAGIGAVLASGGAALAPLIGAVAAGGAVGGSVGGLLAYRVGSRRAHEIEKHLEHGGFALWVRVTPDDEERVAEILKRHGGQEVHAHGTQDIPPKKKTA
jgi:hypothetical protein